MLNRQKIEDAVRLFFDGAGIEITEGTVETPRRVAGYWAELLAGQQYTNRQIAEMFGKRFAVDTPTMIIKQVDNVYSHCEHHLALMYNMRITVAYLPPRRDDGKYQVIGLSKIPRMIDMCAKRLQLQERLGEDIAECLILATGSPDVYVQITADHACVCARGAKSEGGTETVSKHGRFSDSPELCEEVQRRMP